MIYRHWSSVYLVYPYLRELRKTWIKNNHSGRSGWTLLWNCIIICFENRWFFWFSFSFEIGSTQSLFYMEIAYRSEFRNWFFFSKLNLKKKKCISIRNINGDWISFYSSLRNLHKNICPNAYKRVFIPRCCFSAEISLIFFPTRIAEILVNNTASRCERNSSVSARNSSINSAFSQCLF